MTRNLDAGTFKRNPKWNLQAKLARKALGDVDKTEVGAPIEEICVGPPIPKK